jgi:hypothetical protein
LTKVILRFLQAATLGTKVIKYDEEGVQLWFTDIAVSIGVAESVCEDTEYDKGYVIAGWRMNQLE